jgi:hypothetical protein
MLNKTKENKVKTQNHKQRKFPSGVGGTFSLELQVSDVKNGLFCDKELGLTPQANQ